MGEKRALPFDFSASRRIVEPRASTPVRQLADRCRSGLALSKAHRRRVEALAVPTYRNGESGSRTRRFGL